MSRLMTLLIAAAIAIGVGSVQFAQSQTEQAPPAETAPAPKSKKGMTAEEKAKLKEERAAKRKAMTPEEKAQLKQERAKAREEKKAARAAKKAKRQDCFAQGQKDNLKGKKLREFVKTCVAG
jgi:uncharacterized protein HemX